MNECLHVRVPELVNLVLKRQACYMCVYMCTCIASYMFCECHDQIDAHKMVNKILLEYQLLPQSILWERSQLHHAIPALMTLHFYEYKSSTVMHVHLCVM